MKIEIIKAPESVKINTFGQNTFEVAEDAKVVLLEDGDEWAGIMVPAGFVTDLGSVPRIFRPLLSVASAPIPCIVHDYLYSGNVRGVSRQKADAAMLALMKYYNTPRWGWQRRIAWLGVRAGGWMAYRKREIDEDS